MTTNRLTGWATRARAGAVALGCIGLAWYGSSVVPAAWRGAALTVETSQFDLGTVLRGAPLSVDVPLRNLGVRELTVVRTAGACKSAVWLEKPVTIGAGDRGVARVVVNTNFFAEGDFDGVITIVTDNAEPGSVTLKGRVQSEVQASQRYVELKPSADNGELRGRLNILAARDVGVLSVRSTNAAVVPVLRAGTNPGRHEVDLIATSGVGDNVEWLGGAVILATTSRFVPEVRIPFGVHPQMSAVPASPSQP